MSPRNHEFACLPLRSSIPEYKTTSFPVIELRSGYPNPLSVYDEWPSWHCTWHTRSRRQKSCGAHGYLMVDHTAIMIHILVAHRQEDARVNKRSI